jgi:hypothetical protein
MGFVNLMAGGMKKKWKKNGKKRKNEKMKMAY